MTTGFVRGVKVRPRYRGGSAGSSGISAGAPRYARDEEEALWAHRDQKLVRRKKKQEQSKPVTLPKLKCLE